MCDPLNVLVFLRESDAPYREQLVNSDEVRYQFCSTKDEARIAIKKADVVLGSIHFPASLLPLAARLKWIQVTGAGVDAFLAKSQLPEGVRLTRADVSFGDQIAEYVIGHLLALTQRVRNVHHLQASRTWQPLEVEFVKGKMLGIAGTGSIGRAIAERARGIGMRTIGLAREPRQLDGFEEIYAQDDLKTFLAKLDVLVLSLPLTPETRGMIGGKELALLKNTAVLINIARGAIVDEAALIDALRSHAIRGAILDVFEKEPLPANSPLWTMENVTVTSHHAGLNIPSDVIDFFLENLRRFRAGTPLDGQVDLVRGY